jgi:glycyl-tRNA synthetase
MAGGAEAAALAVGEREKLTTMLQHRLFYTPSFRIYGSTSGLYDFGPPGTAAKANLLSLWRRMFVLEEGMLELECPSVTPEAVLRASGHVDKFSDFVVFDSSSNEAFRADHVFKDALERMRVDGTVDPSTVDSEIARLDELNANQLHELFQTYGITSPTTGKPLSFPSEFNLMFQTTIGPHATSRGFLRPETAQGIFVNFNDLLKYNGQRLPFAAAQVGPSYRNEIRPRAGLLRVREFTQAEIEHFVNPKDKAVHPRFGEVKGISLALLPRSRQRENLEPETEEVSRAVERGIIANQTLGYFVARTHLFLLELGIKPQLLRYRQHLEHEMAHYAEDCWDAEIQTSYGWIECVGLADRAAFDLTAHSKCSNEELLAYERFDEPQREMRIRAELNKRKLGQSLKSESKNVTDALQSFDKDALRALKRQLESSGSAEVAGNQITAEMVEIVEEEVTVNGRHYTPSVVEPSFGVGRILYSMLEHCFYVRPEDETRNVMGLPPVIAPTKAIVLPLQNDRRFDSVVAKLGRQMTAEGVQSKVDSTGVSIGKRYARADEVGCPFAITVDYDTLDTDERVTLRERDSTSQVRIPVEKVAKVVSKLTGRQVTWEEDVAPVYPKQA